MTRRYGGEGAVKLIYPSIYPKIQEREFLTWIHWNAAIRVALGLRLTTLRSQAAKYSRREQFEEIERDSLRKLHPIRFELRHRYGGYRDEKRPCHRLWGSTHYYSVPLAALYGKKSHPVWYTFTPGMHLLRLRADCPPIPATGGPLPVHEPLEEHLASHHRYITEWNPTNLYMRRQLSIRTWRHISVG